MSNLIAQTKTVAKQDPAFIIMLVLCAFIGIGTFVIFTMSLTAGIVVGIGIASAALVLGGMALLMRFV